MAKLQLLHYYRNFNRVLRTTGEWPRNIKAHQKWASQCVRLGYLSKVRRWRAIRNGTHLTRQHLARRPRAFHWVLVGDYVHVWGWVFGRYRQQEGLVDAIQIGWFRSPLVRVNGEWFRFAQTYDTGYRYVH